MGSKQTFWYNEGHVTTAAQEITTKTKAYASHDLKYCSFI